MNSQVNKVDRILAIWQALNPGKKVTPGLSGYDTAMAPPDSMVDENTPLAPFHISDQKAWTSADTYKVSDFGYYYPDQHIAWKWVKELAASIGLHVEKDRKEWIVAASLKPFEFSKSGYIHIFLSPHAPTVQSSGPAAWLQHPDLVGSIPLFINSSGQCANCNNFAEAGRKIYGQTFLTGQSTSLRFRKRFHRLVLTICHSRTEEEGLRPRPSPFRGSLLERQPSLASFSGACPVLIFRCTRSG